MSTVSAVSALEPNDYPRRSSFDLRAYRRVRDRTQVFALGYVVQHDNGCTRGLGEIAQASDRTDGLYFGGMDMHKCM